MNYGGDRGLQAEIAAIAVHAHVVGKVFSMAAEVESVVCLVEIARAERELGLVIAFKSGARHNIENAISTIAKLSAVAPAIYLDVIHVFRIELCPEVLRNCGVDDRDAIEQPSRLVASAHVEHVMGNVSAGHII